MLKLTNEDGSGLALIDPNSIAYMVDPTKYAKSLSGGGTVIAFKNSDSWIQVTETAQEVLDIMLRNKNEQS